MEKKYLALENEWDVRKGDYVSEEDDYVRRHLRAIKAEKVRKNSLRFVVAVLLLSGLYLVLHTFSRI